MSVGAVTLTSAYLFDKAEIVNTAEEGAVTIEIEEDFNGIEKNNVQIKNTGTVPAYIRVAIVPIWRDEEGNPTALSAKDTYTVSLNDSDWFVGDDGFYYCVKETAPTELTPVLIKSCTVNENLTDEYNNKTFDLQVLAQSIQSKPQNAVTEAWGVGVDDSGCLIP